jgi:hypothetical protein
MWAVPVTPRQVIFTVCGQCPSLFAEGDKSKGCPLSVMAHLKRSFVEVKALENCLAHAIIIAKKSGKLSKLYILSQW